MQKKTLLPALIVFLASLASVYALTVNLFPNTASLPRIPTGDGTIGGVIARIIGTTALDSYLGDGTVRDSRMLSGVTASGYLKSVTCIVGGVMIGIDADGEALCGPKSKLLVGTWTEGTNATRCPVGTGPCDPLNIGDLLYEGEIIRTNPTHTGTITFADDLSLLRLDVGTVVELQSGLNTAGQTVAQAILENGQLWGRIVSNTGVNIGGGGVIAGVRGTSLSLTEASDTFTMSVVDSVVSTAGTAVSITTAEVIKLSPEGLPLASWQYSDRAKFRQYIYTSGAIVSPTQLTAGGGSSVFPEYQQTRDSLYSLTPWIRENTKKDIEYLYIQKSPDAERTPDIISRAAAEYAATVDTTDTPALKALCDGQNVFWPSLVGTSHDRCQLATLFAFADYTKMSPDTHRLYTYTDTYPTMNKNSTGTLASLDGYLIKGTGALFYTGAAFDILKGGLAGKTITINLGARVGNSLTPGWQKAYLIDMGTQKWFITNNVPCSGLSSVSNPPGNYICETVVNGGSSTAKLGGYNSETSMSFIINSNIPTQFILGNTPVGSPAYNLPIGTYIKRITIQ